MHNQSPFADHINIHKYRDGLFNNFSYGDIDCLDSTKLEEYIHWIRELSTLSIVNEGYYIVKLSSFTEQNYICKEPMNIDYQYYQLSNDVYVYYVRFCRMYDSDESESDDECNLITDECEEMIAIMNTNGKYICVGQWFCHSYIHTNIYNYDNSHGEGDLLFDQQQYNTIDVNTLLNKALSEIESCKRREGVE